MTEQAPAEGGQASVQAGGQEAAFVDFESFRAGLPRGRYEVIVNPELARRFVAYRLHATPVTIAAIGIGIAAAIAGYALAGGLLVLAGLLFRRAIKIQAPKILLHLASRQADLYEEATAHGVLEVRQRS